MRCRGGENNSLSDGVITLPDRRNLSSVTYHRPADEFPPKRSHSSVQRALDIWCMMGVKVAMERVKYYNTSMLIQFSASSLTSWGSSHENDIKISLK